MRFDPVVLERLRRYVRARPGLSASALTSRFVDEALRMEEHPGVLFRDGPSGRRAVLIGRPRRLGGRPRRAVRTRFRTYDSRDYLELARLTEASQAKAERAVEGWKYGPLGRGLGTNDPRYCLMHSVGGVSECQALDAAATVATGVNRVLGPIAEYSGGPDLERCAEKAMLSSCFWAAASIIPGSKGGKALKEGIEALRAAKGVTRGWKVGDDIWAMTAAGRAPSWSTVRARYWKNAAAYPKFAAQWDEANLARMRRGLAPQRFNPDKGGMESMELSHELIPAREGGTNLVPRWPQDHAAVDPYRYTGY